MYMQATNRGVDANPVFTNIVDPMLDIGSLLILAHNRKTGKMFASPTSMIVSAVLR
jgi:hypothetical protein